MNPSPESLITPISRKQSLREIVGERIRSALLSGEIAAGERFTESQLAEGLGTSRAPVREALRELEQEGLIVPSGQRGYILRPVDAEDVRELGLLRSSLERLAARLAVERSSAEEIATLRELVDRMRTEEKATPAANLEQLDAEIHERLCRLSRHEALLGIWLSMRDRLTLAMRAVNMSWNTTGGFADSHDQLVKALESGDPAKAESAAEVHILSGLDRLMTVAGKADRAES